MSNPWNRAATTITAALALESPIVGVAFCDSPPEGIETFEGAAPAGCSFWQLGQDRTFATVTADHENCPIGVHTHQLTGASPSVASDLGDVLQTMASLTYVRDEDVATIPVMQRSVSTVVYGPAAEMGVAPDVVLMLANGRIGLIIAEAIEQVEGAPARALGRPACALIPAVINNNAAAASLGCCGARAYMDSLTDEIALWGLPGARLTDYAERLTALATANRTLGEYHASRRKEISG